MNRISPWIFDASFKMSCKTWCWFVLYWTSLKYGIKIWQHRRFSIMLCSLQKGIYRISRLLFDMLSVIESCHKASQTFSKCLNNPRCNTKLSNKREYLIILWITEKSFSFNQLDKQHYIEHDQILLVPLWLLLTLLGFASFIYVSSYNSHEDMGCTFITYLCSAHRKTVKKGKKRRKL